MKTSAQINIERLTKRDVEHLASTLANLGNELATIHSIAGRYEGRWHTRLDRVACELRDCVATLGSIVGDRAIDTLSESGSLTTHR